MLQIGQQAPKFTLEDQSDRWTVLYFYPKDDTPGCTTEAIDFTTLKPQFDQLEAIVIGVSPDSEESHCKFITKHNLNVQLLSDPNREILEKYGVWQLKKFMGKEYLGVVRTTFLISPDGTIAHIWNNVKAKGHAEKVLEKLRELQG